MGSNGGLLSSHSLSYFRDPILFPFKQPTVSVIYSKNQIHRIQIHLAWSILLRFVVTYKRISRHTILYKIQNNPKIYQFIPYRFFEKASFEKYTIVRFYSIKLQN